MSDAERLAWQGWNYVYRLKGTKYCTNEKKLTMSYEGVLRTCFPRIITIHSKEIVNRAWSQSWRRKFVIKKLSCHRFAGIKVQRYVIHALIWHRTADVLWNEWTQNETHVTYGKVRERDGFFFASIMKQLKCQTFEFPASAIWRVYFLKLFAYDVRIFRVITPLFDRVDLRLGENGKVLHRLGSLFTLRSRDFKSAKYCTPKTW